MILSHVAACLCVLFDAELLVAAIMPYHHVIPPDVPASLFVYPAV